MLKEKEKRIVEKFPKLFIEYHRKEEPIGHWGFECADGWYNLIYIICRYIEDYLESHKDIEPVSVVQIKNKFGGLRFYIEGGDNHLREIVWNLSSLAPYICENCGNVEDIRQTKHGYIQNLCKNCFNE